MFLIFLFAFLLSPLPVSADTGHIVISEIQTYGANSNDDIIRLYNPTNEPINLLDWRLEKKTASSPTSTPIISSFDEKMIAPKSYFLIVHATYYSGNETYDAEFPKSYSLSDNNTIILKDAEKNIIDKVGFGTAADYETAPAPNPEKGYSIKRRDNIDTDNNQNDFYNTAETMAAETTAESPLPAAQISPAQYGDVVINEIVPNPAEGKEWIELLNLSSKNFDLSGWKISDGASIIYSLSGTLAPGGFITAEINSRLNNAGDAVYLSDQTGASIAQLIYGNWAGGRWPAPEKGQSLARTADGNYQANETPTKNEKNIFIKSNLNEDAANNEPEAAPDYSKISIIEIMPNPEGGDTEGEYIKIHNSGEGEINLGGLYLDDADGGSNPYKIPADTIIAGNTDLTFLRAKTKIALNNDEDEARILSKNKEELAAISYEGAKEGAIYKFQNGKWSWSTAGTIPAVPIGQAGASQNSAANSATGIVIVPPNILSTQTMYINGLQLYMYYHDWPELKIGDKIAVSGEPSTYYNEPRLKLKSKNSIKIISSGNEIAPQEISADDIGDDFVGRLVSISGELVEKTSQKITLETDGVEIPIYDKLKSAPAGLKVKDEIKITGILSKYKNDFRIIPRSESDFQITAAAPEEKPIDTPNNIWQYLASTLTIGAFAGGTTLLRRKKNAAEKLG